MLRWVISLVTEAAGSLAGSSAAAIYAGNVPSWASASRDVHATPLHLRGAQVQARRPGLYSASTTTKCSNTTGQVHQQRIAAPRLRPRRDLGVRPRQHALSAPRQSLAAGGRAHPRLHRGLPQDQPRGSVPAAEGLLQALRHLDARADDRARHEAGRLPRFRAPGRSLAARAQSRRSASPSRQLPGRKLILTNGTRSHADAVLARLQLDRHFEDVFDIVAARARTEAVAADLRPLPQGARRRRRQRRRCSRTSRATSRCRTGSA